MNNDTLYLVTGAAGFLGSNVCRELIERGNRVRAFVLSGDKAAKYVPDEAEICYGDLCDPKSLETFFEAPEGTDTIVIHCAGMVTVNPDFNRKLIDINVGGTKHIIEKCVEHRECRKLVYVSSTGAIPEAPRGQKIKETDWTDPIDFERIIGCYSQSKALATKEVLDAAKNRNLNACIVYPSGILGPDDFAVGETTATLLKIMRGDMPVGMKGSFNLCDVRDLAHGCVMAADKGEKGESYILGNKEVTLKELCDMLHKESGCKKIKIYLPLWLADMIAKRMEKRAAKTGTKPLMTTFSVYNLARNNAFDCTKAKKLLGYETRPYEETIHDEVRWIMEQGLLTQA